MGRHHIEHRTEKPRKPWTDAELKSFFGLPLFTRYELPANFKGAKEAAYWVPLLGTGARVGELCQLCVQDVEQTKAGPFLRITEEAERRPPSRPLPESGECPYMLNSSG